MKIIKLFAVALVPIVISSFTPPKCKFKVNTIDQATGVVKKVTEQELLTTKFTTKNDILIADAIREGNTIYLSLGLTVMSDRSLDALVKKTDYTVITLENDSAVKLTPSKEIKPSLFAQKAGVNFQYGFNLNYQPLTNNQLHLLTTNNVKKVEVFYTNNNTPFVSRIELKEKYSEVVKNLLSCVM